MSGNVDEDRIRKALHAEDELAIRQFDPTANESVFGQMFDLLKGKARWWTMLVGLWSFVFFGIQVWAAVRFFNTTDTREQLMWVAIFLWCGMAVGMLKLWMWLQMNKNAVKRELKRLELQVAHMSEKLGN